MKVECEKPAKLARGVPQNGYFAGKTVHLGHESAKICPRCLWSSSTSQTEARIAESDRNCSRDRSHCRILTPSEE